MRIFGSANNISMLSRTIRSSTEQPFVNAAQPDRLMGIPVDVDLYMDDEGPTGRYVLPNGLDVNRQDVRVERGFVKYGPEDLDYLLYAGIVTYHVGPRVILFDDSKFAMGLSPGVPDNRDFMELSRKITSGLYWAASH